MGEADGQSQHAAWLRLVEQATEGGELDNEKFLEKMGRRLDSVGVSFPGVEVRFEGVSACAKVQVGARGLPTLPNVLANQAVAVLRELRLLKDCRRLFFALHGCSGILKPGRMTLLLGPPGSGNSTLLRILAGKAERELGVQGEVTYNGRPGSHFVLPRSVAFVPQTDSHMGEMTVRETLKFSARLQGPGHRAELFRQVEEKEREAGIKPDDVMEAVMKLSLCHDLLFFLRFFTHFSFANLIPPPSPLIPHLTPHHVPLIPRSLLPHSLPHRTAHSIVVMLDTINCPSTPLSPPFIAPYPHPSTQMLGLDVCADTMVGDSMRRGVSGGQTKEEVLGFFQEMGFAPPARKGVADFLQEVTSLKDQEQYWKPNQLHPYHYVSVRAFEEAFQASRFGKQMEAELSMPFKKDRGAFEGEGEGKDVEDEGEKGTGERGEVGASLALAQRRFVLHPLATLTIVAGREWLVMRRNLFLYIVQTMQILPIAIVTMSVFWRSQLSITLLDSNFYLGAIFFGIVTMLSSSIIELTLLTARLPIFFLQRDNLLFPAWAWSAPMALLSLPVSLWSAGLHFPAAAILCHAHGRLCVLPAVATVLRSTTLINTLGNIIIVLLFLLSGFIVCACEVCACEVCDCEVCACEVCDCEVCACEVCACEVCACEVCACEVCACEVCACEVCACEVCACEVCACEVCACEVCACEVCACEVCACEVRDCEVCACEVCACEVCACEVCACEVRDCEVCACEVCACEVCACEVCACEVRDCEVCACEVCACEVCACEVRDCEVCACEVCACEVCACEVCACEVCACEVRDCEVCACEVCACEVCACEVCACEVRDCEVCACEVCACEVCACEVCACEVRDCEVCACEVCACEVCACEVRDCEVCACEVCDCEVCACEVCACEVCACEVCACEVCDCEVCACEVCAREVCACEVCACEVCACEVCACEVCACEVCACE
ncbi:unnamed protein product, partial [Closterium sp. Naga37s-1]